MSTDKGDSGSIVEAKIHRVRSSLARSTLSSAESASLSTGKAGKSLFPDDVYRGLHQARTVVGSLRVDYALGWRTPIIGPLWMIVRRRIHQEIRIYVDALITQQNNLNTHVVRAVTRIVEAIDRLELPALVKEHRENTRAITTLQSEIRALRAEVESLQSQLDGADSLATPDQASSGVSAVGDEPKS